MSIPLKAPILVVKPEWLELLLNGDKTVEIRSTACRLQVGTIVYFSPSRSGHVSGSAIFLGSIFFADAERWESARSLHLVSGPLPYPRTHGWMFGSPCRFDQTVPYLVKKGSVVWRKFEPIAEQ